MRKCGNSTKKTSCLLGAHFSIAKGLHNAIYEAQALGCNVLQIFTKNSNTWKERTLSQDETKPPVCKRAFSLKQLQGKVRIWDILLLKHNIL